MANAMTGCLTTFFEESTKKKNNNNNNNKVVITYKSYETRICGGSCNPSYREVGI
jgi:hypothetical protein